MEKMKMETSDGTKKNIERIKALFPNVITEMKDEKGNLKEGIDFERLKQELSGDVVEGTERYDFTWVGKKAAILEANTPIRKTLRPCIEESKDWETTENLYIEGDNLDVLKLLQESYLGKVKMIYIDPPYNTGNDFIYRDNFTRSCEEYDDESGVYDEEGDRLFKNTETNGRFHSDWCSMMYPRLVLARNLLREDGVVFISIDDSEVAQLRKICDEVLGESNFVACIVWERAYSPVNLKKHFSESHDYIICYAKTLNNLVCNGLPRSEEADNRYSNQDNDPRGNWASDNLSVGPAVESNIYAITTPSGRKVMPPNGYSWRLSQARFAEFLSDNRIWFGDDGNGVPRIKRFLSEVKQGITPMTIWKYQEVGHSQKASQDLKRLFDDKSVFTYPKPVELVKRLLELYTNSNSIILDFFSGSATTAHAVMQLNAEDSGKRKFIMVQLQEPCDESSEAFRAGYKNICEIGKERIRRAGEKIKEEIQDSNKQIKMGEEPKTVPDIGFRVFKADSTNMKDVYYAPHEYSQERLLDFESNIKEERTELDLLYGVLLEWGLPLSLKHEMETVEGIAVHTIDHNALIACFACQVPENVFVEIAKRQPLRAVFRDGSFSSSQDKINAWEIFKEHAPNTQIKVL